MRTSTLKHLSRAILTLAFTSWAFAATAPIGTVTVGGGTGGGSTPIATTQYPGKVKPDGTTVTVEIDGTIHAVPPLATTSTPGAVKVGTGLSVSPDGTLNNTGVAGVASFNGRGGAVKPGFSDYSASMVKGLASVAKTGAYGDLTGKPAIPAAQVSSDWNAASGVAQILNKPTIPSSLSQLTQSPGYRTVTDTEKATWNAVTAAPVTKVNGKTGDVTLTATDVGADALGSATSVQTTLSAAIDAKPSVKVVSGGTYQSTPAAIYVGSTTPSTPGAADFWLDTTTSVSPVCISGSYNDLIDKPTSLGGGAWGQITGTLSAQTDLWDKFQLYMLKSDHDTYAAAVQVKFDNMSTQFHALRTAVAASGVTLTPTASVSPTSLSFGSVNTGSTSALTVRLTNTGLANLVTTTTSLSGTDAAKFTKTGDGCASQTLAPNAYCDEQITFTPGATAGGPYSASLAIAHNATGSPTSVALSGTTPADPCADTTTPGTVCSDGTVYAGLTPDGNVKMYAARCDAGQVWSGTACTGTRSTPLWSAGVAVATGVTNANTGAANTTTLAALSNADSPYSAAQYCDSLDLGGRADWYLPARAELAVLYTNKAAVGNFGDSTWYWASTEQTAANAYIYNFASGLDAKPKNLSAATVRCVRK